MDMNESIDFGTPDHVNLASSYLQYQIRCVHLAREVLGEPDNSLELAMKGFLWSTLGAAQAFDMHAKELHISCAYVQARVLFETALNGCYICVRGEKEAKRAIGYAMQKIARNARREIKHPNGDFIFEHEQAESIWNDARTKELLNEFTNKKGKEIRQWTPHNVVERIEAIETALGSTSATSLRFAFFNIYSDASEVIHGSFYGTLVGLELSTPGSAPKTTDEVTSEKCRSVVLLYMLLGGVLSDLISAMAETFKNDQHERLRKLTSEASIDFCEAVLQGPKDEPEKGAKAPKKRPGEEKAES